MAPAGQSNPLSVIVRKGGPLACFARVGQPFGLVSRPLSYGGLGVGGGGGGCDAVDPFAR